MNELKTVNQVLEMIDSPYPRGYQLDIIRAELEKWQGEIDRLKIDDYTNKACLKSLQADNAMLQQFNVDAHKVIESLMIKIGTLKDILDVIPDNNDKED